MGVGGGGGVVDGPQEVGSDGRGYFLRPTVLTGVTPAFEIWQTEVFGPVLCVVPFTTEVGG